MYKTPKYSTTYRKHNSSTQGESIEQKMERILNNKEPIKDGAPIIYTDRKEGVRASTNIRTDRWEVAIEATDKIAKSYMARREENAAAKNDKKEVGGAESIQGKEGGTSTDSQTT